MARRTPCNRNKLHLELFTPERWLIWSRFTLPCVMRTRNEDNISWQTLYMMMLMYPSEYQPYTGVTGSHTSVSRDASNTILCLLRSLMLHARLDAVFALHDGVRSNHDGCEHATWLILPVTGIRCKTGIQRSWLAISGGSTSVSSDHTTGERCTWRWHHKHICSR